MCRVKCALLIHGDSCNEGAKEVFLAVSPSVFDYWKISRPEEFFVYQANVINVCVKSTGVLAFSVDKQETVNYTAIWIKNYDIHVSSEFAFEGFEKSSERCDLQVCLDHRWIEFQNIDLCHRWHILERWWVNCFCGKTDHRVHYLLWAEKN